MLIPSLSNNQIIALASLSRRVNANSQLDGRLRIGTLQAYQEG